MMDRCGTSAAVPNLAPDLVNPRPELGGGIHYNGFGIAISGKYFYIKNSANAKQLKVRIKSGLITAFKLG